MSEIGSVRVNLVTNRLVNTNPVQTSPAVNFTNTNNLYLNKNNIQTFTTNPAVPAQALNLTGEAETDNFSQNYHLLVNTVKATNSTAREAVKYLKVDDYIAVKLVQVYDFVQWSKIKNLSADELSVNYKAQMKLQAISQNTNEKLVREISELVGVEIKGKPKDVLRIIDKLQKTNTQLTDLYDITRARIDLPKLDKEQIEFMTKTIIEKYSINPKNDIKDFMKEVSNPVSEYKGRVHLSIPAENGLRFELQIGPKQLTTFYGTKFKIRGVEQNFHDAIYKGINLYLVTPDKGDEYIRAMKSLGDGNVEKGEQLASAALKNIGNGDINKGKEVLNGIKTKYFESLNDIMKFAENGKDFDFAKLNKTIISDLQKVYRNIPSESLPPVFKEKMTKTLTKTSSQLSKLYSEIHKLPVDMNGKNLLRELAKKNLSENTMKNIFKAVEATAVNPETTAGLLNALKRLSPDMIEKAIASDDGAESLIKLSKKITPFLKNYGEEGTQLAAKIGKGITKALPVIGGTISAADSYRLGTISSTGIDPFTKREYKDPDVRRLAGIGAGVNGFDAAITATEVFGFRTIDLPVQLALTGVEIAIDVLVEKFNDNPGNMTDKTRELIQSLSFN